MDRSDDPLQPGWVPLTLAEWLGPERVVSPKELALTRLDQIARNPTTPARDAAERADVLDALLSDVSAPPPRGRPRGSGNPAMAQAVRTVEWHRGRGMSLRAACRLVADDLPGIDPDSLRQAVHRPR
jgi:hypothetical protein